MMSAIYFDKGVKSLGGFFYLGNNFYLNTALMIFRAYEGLNFSLCLGLIWYSFVCATGYFGIDYETYLNDLFKL